VYNGKPMNKLLAIILMIITLTLGHVLDLWTRALRQGAMETFNIRPVVWGGIAANLMIIVTILTLFWLVAIKLNRSPLVSLIFILMGIFILAYLPLLVAEIEPISIVLAAPLFRPLRLSIMALGPQSYLFFSGVSILVIGLAQLLPKGKTPPLRWLQNTVKYLAMSPVTSWFLARILHRIDRFILRISKHRLSATGMLTGLPVVTLIVKGAKSGKLRMTPLVGIPDEDRVVLIATNFGRTRHPAWYHNLLANPQVQLSIRGQINSYIAQETHGEERQRLWLMAINLYRGYAVYEQRARGRFIPVMVLTPISNPGTSSF